MVEAGLDQVQRWIHDALACLRAVLAEWGVVSLFVRWHPLLTAPPSWLPEGVWDVWRGKVVVIDLNKSDEWRWRDMRRNHRQNITRLWHQGFWGIMDNSDASVAAFAAMYRQTMERVSAASFYYFSNAYIADLMRIPGAQICLTVNDENEPVSERMIVARG